MLKSVIHKSYNSPRPWVSTSCTDVLRCPGSDGKLYIFSPKESRNLNPEDRQKKQKKCKTNEAVLLQNLPANVRLMHMPLPQLALDHQCPCPPWKSEAFGNPLETWHQRIGWLQNELSTFTSTAITAKFCTAEQRPKNLTKATASKPGGGCTQPCRVRVLLRGLGLHFPLGFHENLMTCPGSVFPKICSPTPN